MNDTIRRRMLREATRLFAQRGYGSTSVRELVEATGVTKPTLYYHFGSKEGLFVATATAHLDHFDAMTEQALAVGDDLETRLVDLMRAHIGYAVDHPDTIRFLMTCLHQVDHGQPEIDLMSIDTTIMRHLGTAFEQARGRGELDPDVDVPTAALSFLGVLRAWALAAFHGQPLADDIHESVVHQFLHGIDPR